MGKGGNEVFQPTEKKKLTKAEMKDLKQGLIEKNGDLSKQLKAVLGEIFTRFDADGDGALSRQELETFANTSQTGSNLSEDEIKQLGTFFDTNDKGQLTRKGFEQMYLMQSGSQPDDTWKDLKTLGYSKSLELLGTTAPPPVKAPPAAQAMDSLRTALAELKVSPDSASAHRRVGVCLQELGREEAAKKSFAAADDIDQREARKLDSTVEDCD